MKRRVLGTRRTRQQVGFSLDIQRRPSCKSTQDMFGWTVTGGKYNSHAKAWIIDQPQSEIEVQGMGIGLCAWVRFCLVSLIDGSIIEYYAEQQDIQNVPYIGNQVGFSKSTKNGIVGYACDQPNPPAINDIILHPKQNQFPPCAIISFEIDFVGNGTLLISYPFDPDYSPNCSDMLSVSTDKKAFINMNYDSIGWNVNPPMSAEFSRVMDVMSNGGAGPFTAELWADAPGYSGSGTISTDCTFDSSC